jgi:D-lactate dehydrogenase (cytochrome)
VKTYTGQQYIKENFPDVLYDESRFTSGIPQKICFPQTTEDVREIAREAFASGTPLSIVGAQTGITGGGVPVANSIAVCFSEMNAIVRVDMTDINAPVVYCQPGATLSQINGFLAEPSNCSCKTGQVSIPEPGLWIYPPDPTEATAQIGGTAATNASGARSYHFGPTRNHIASLSLVFADGDFSVVKRDYHIESNDFFSFLTENGKKHIVKRPAYQSPDIKNAAGYYSKKNMDLVDLFIGSEGTLALFAEIGIKLTKSPVFLGGMSFFPGRSMAFDFASFLRTESGVAAIEYFDESAIKFVGAKIKNGDIADIPDFPGNCAVYWEYMETSLTPFESRMDLWEKELLSKGSSFDATWSGFDKKESEFLKKFRHAVPELVNSAVAANKKKCPSVRKISTDTALPQENFSATMENYIALFEKNKLEYVIFGHLGDFHLHCNLLPKNNDELRRALLVYDDIMDLTIKNNGTISAEHGIGKIKTQHLCGMYGNEVMAEMRRIKSDFDPKWLLNRGNLFERLPDGIL